MKNFKYILISSIIIFCLNFPAHFLFDILNNDIIAVFFPTNESIFQHMKMIFTCYFIFYLILFIISKKFSYNNVFLTNLISSTATITLFLIVYLPVYLRFGELMIFTLILLFLTILFGQFVSNFFLKKEDYKAFNIISIVLIVTIFIIGGYLTYNPIKTMLFWDPEHETYEIVTKD